MSDIVKLLPDSVANQIAAGEVVQRPASVVKELLENSIDAGSTDIQLIIKDAGKSLIHIFDNGCGMSETDARMCFERHATSKIKNAEDLYSIKTFGFRGEAMASIAAVSQIELRSRREQDELATEILIEGSVVKSQNPCSAPVGTSIAVKNLFYNVPARRKFLKSENVELKHIIDEFTRVAMVNPKIKMELSHNGRQIFGLPKSTLKERIVNLMGNSLTTKLLPVDTETEYVSISGYIGKPEFAKKNRGEQFFFVNYRFIRSPFLHHAIENAFQLLLPENSIPSYFIFLELNPEDIDINIHPTKTEVKFTNEQMVYQFLLAAVKQSIGKYNITPSLDFDLPPELNFIPNNPKEPTSAPSVKINPNYNPFDATFGAPARREALDSDKDDPEYLDKLFGKTDEQSIFQQVENEVYPAIPEEISYLEDTEVSQKYFGLFENRFIITTYKSEYLLINRAKALERIYFERNLQRFKTKQGVCQKLLFPKTIDVSKAETSIINEIISDLKNLGFDISEFGANTFIIHGIPSGIPLDFDAEIAIREMIEQFNKGIKKDTLKLHETLALTLARRMVSFNKNSIHQNEVSQLIDELFKTSAPNVSPDGKLIIKALNVKDLETLMNL